MQITVTITPESYARMQAFLFKRVQKAGSKLPALIGGVFGLSAMATSWLLTNGIFFGLIIAAYGIVFLLAIAIVGKSRAKGHMAQLGKCYYGEFAFTLQADGVHVANTFFTTHFIYAAFIETVTTTDHLLLLTGPITGLHLPITDANRDAVTAFHDEMKQRMVSPAL